MIKYILDSGEYAVQTYRSCMGIMRLSKGYTNEIMEKASREALDKKICSYKYFSIILKQAGAKTEENQAPKELLLEIQEVKNESRYTKFMTKLQNIKLLILDDIGLSAYTLEESRDILEITECRYNKNSTVLSGQVPHTQWYDLFPDPTIADAIMDRVIHNSYILALDSKKSMRAVMAEKAIQDIKETD